MLNTKNKLLLILFATLLLMACKEDKKHKINFYYWKTNVNIGETEKEYFEKLDAEKLYMRFFDVDKEADGWYAYPKAKIKLFDPSVLDAEYIPVVFITNRVFSSEKQEPSEGLAKSVDKLINMIVEKNGMATPTEIQIDCDWTNSTREAYFEFLRELKTISQKDISCTLRLHQIKDKDYTGIPPVDKGYLMCYATSSPQETDVQNSILDIQLLKNYTQNINEYPLPFDVALPLYTWGVVTNHRGEIKIINNVSIAGLDSFFEKTGENTYEALDDFFLQGVYMNKGFTLRIERIGPALLDEAKTYLDNKIDKPYDIVYYHLDKPFLEAFTIDELK